MSSIKQENKKTREKIRLENRKTIIRFLIYYLLAFLGFLIITTFRFPFASPLLPISLALVVSVYETSSPFVTGIFGLVCGLLLDNAMGTFSGFNGIIIMAMTVFVSLVFRFYFERSFVGSLIAGTLGIFIQTVLHYVFWYLLWHYDESGAVLRQIFVPQFIVTVISSVLYYFLIKPIGHFLGEVREYYDEEI